MMTNYHIMVLSVISGKVLFIHQLGYCFESKTLKCLKNFRKLFEMLEDIEKSLGIKIHISIISENFLA